tara:strand:+ start:409 stop:1086 length:678 start_codon:yes stop_codon:yes gene_type:complete
MALILHIETATTNCSVALSVNGELVALNEINDGYAHAENLSILVEKCIKYAGKSLKELNAISVSLGPGSYTGLRIGVSTAKGLAYALSIPIIGIGTLEAFAHAGDVSSFNGVKIPMLDARRMEVYQAVYKDNKLLEEVSANIITVDSFTAYANEQVLLYGPGADKLDALFGEFENIEVRKGVFPSAKDMIIPAMEKYQKEEFEDVAYFEPFYLKDFVAGKPKKLL